MGFTLEAHIVAGESYYIILFCGNKSQNYGGQLEVNLRTANILGIYQLGAHPPRKKHEKT